MNARRRNTPSRPLLNRYMDLPTLLNDTALLATDANGSLTWITPVYLLIALALVLVNGLFVLAEFAIVKVRSTRIEELARQGNARAAAAQHIITRLDAYLSATQLGITMASLALGWVGEPAFSELMGKLFGQLPFSSGTRHTLSIACAFAIITFLHILLGEVAP